MSLKAFGAYITQLRKEEGLSRLAFSKVVGTSNSNLMRIEQGSQEAGAMILAVIVKNLNADLEDVIKLLLSENDEPEYGITMANDWIKRRDSKGNKSNEMHPDIVSLVYKMSEYELGKWVSMGERLLEERTKQK